MLFFTFPLIVLSFAFFHHLQYHYIFTLIMDRDDEILDRFSPSYQAAPKLSDETKMAELQAKKEAFMMQQNRDFLEQLFRENRHQPIKIRNVQITNGNHFRDSFLAAQFAPLTATSRAISLEKLLSDVDSISKLFANLGVVDNIMVSFNPLRPNIFRRTDTIDLVPVFNVVPAKRFYAKTGTNIGNGEGDGYIQFQFKNLFGGAEHLTFDAITGTKTSLNYLANYTMPIWNNLKYIWESTVSLNTRKYDWIRADVVTRSLNNRIFTQYDSSVNHELIFENSWRQLKNSLSKLMDVLLQAGSNFKSSIAYNVVFDTRLSKTLPGAGKFFKWGVEWNMREKSGYIKTSAASQLAYPLGKHSKVIITHKAGALQSLNGQPSYILDRFFSGGPNDVRSFEMNSLGPKQFNSSVGGDVFANGGLSLVTDLPKYTDSNFKFHHFVNYGKLVKLEGGMMNTLKSMTYGYLVGVGMGILYNHPMARFELNFVLPVTASERDGIRKGLQYGIGVSFM